MDPCFPFDQKQLRQCDRFLRGRVHDWTFYKRSFHSPAAHRGADELLDQGRRVTAAILIHVLTKDRRAVEQARGEGEAGYFFARMHGHIQYLLWWVDGWYPGQQVGNDGIVFKGSDCGGEVIQLRIRGFAKHFNKTLRAEDPKLRRQLVLLDSHEHLTCGFFPVKGDFVKVLLVDDYEAIFFLRPKGFKAASGLVGGRASTDSHGSNNATREEDDEPFWSPVGVVVQSLPLRDAAVVRVHFLCCTELVRVSNVHLVGINEDEYQATHSRIMAARSEGLSIVEAALCQQEPQLIVRIACTISGQRCLATFWDQHKDIRLHLYNNRLGRQLVLLVDDPTCLALGLFTTTATTTTLPADKEIRDMSLQEKEALCKRFIYHVGVSRGALYVFGVQQPPPDVNPLLKHVRGLLLGVHVEVGFRGIDRTHISIWVTHLIGPATDGDSSTTTSSDKNKNDQQGDVRVSTRTYHLAPLTLEQWRGLGFPDLDWLTEGDRERLCGQLLRRMRACQGYPALVMDDDSLVLPQDFQPHDENKDYSKASTGLQGESPCSTDTASPSTMFRWARRLPIIQEGEEESAAPPRTPTDDAGPPAAAPEACRMRRFVITARLSTTEGHLEFCAHVTRPEAASAEDGGAQPLQLTLTCSDWHAPLHYGPLQWASHAQLSFLTDLFCDRLVVRGGHLCFQAAPMLAYRSRAADGSLLTDAIVVRDHGNHLRVVSGQDEVRLESRDTVKAVGIAVRHLQWAGLPLRKHLCARLARLARYKVVEDGEDHSARSSSRKLVVENGPILVWKAVQRKIREGCGPMLVSVWDLGSSLEVTYRDHRGVLIERTTASLQHLHELVGRELWPTIMPADTREVALRQLIRHVGGRNRRSAFSRFLSLRSKEDDARLARLVYVRHKVLTSEHDVVEHIKRIRPDPSRLPPRDIESLLRVLHSLKEMEKMMNAGDRRRRSERVRVKVGARRVQSIFHKALPSPQHICECCYQESGPRHAATCSHEFAVCRICVIQARSRLIVNRLPYVRARVAELLRNNRPSEEQQPSLPPAEMKRRRRDLLRAYKLRADMKQRDRQALLTPIKGFYIGTEIAPRLPARSKHGKKGKHHHHHHHHHDKDRKRSTEGETSFGATTTCKTMTGAVSTATSGWATVTAAGELGDMDDDDDDDLDDDDDEDEEEGTEGRRGETKRKTKTVIKVAKAMAAGKTTRLSPRRTKAAKGRPPSPSDEKRQQAAREVVSILLQEMTASIADAARRKRAEDTARRVVEELLQEALSSIVEARTSAAGLMTRRDVSTTRMATTRLMGHQTRTTMEVLEMIQQMFTSMNKQPSTRRVTMAWQEEEEEGEGEGDEAEEKRGGPKVTFQEVTAALLGDATVASSLLPPSVMTAALKGDGSDVALVTTSSTTGAFWEELYYMLREEVFDVLDDVMLCVESRMPRSWEEEREEDKEAARLQSWWALDDIMTAIESSKVAMAMGPPPPITTVLDIDRLIYGEEGSRLSSSPSSSSTTMVPATTTRQWMTARRGATARERKERRMGRLGTTTTARASTVLSTSHVPSDKSVVRQRLSGHIALAHDYYQQGYYGDGDVAAAVPSQEVEPLPTTGAEGEAAAQWNSYYTNTDYGEQAPGEQQQPQQAYYTYYDEQGQQQGYYYHVGGNEAAEAWQQQQQQQQQEGGSQEEGQGTDSWQQGSEAVYPPAVERTQAGTDWQMNEGAAAAAAAATAEYGHEHYYYAGGAGEAEAQAATNAWYRGDASYDAATAQQGGGAEEGYYYNGGHPLDAQASAATAWHAPHDGGGVNNEDQQEAYDDSAAYYPTTPAVDVAAAEVTEAAAAGEWPSGEQGNEQQQPPQGYEEGGEGAPATAWQEHGAAGEGAAPQGDYSSGDYGEDGVYNTEQQQQQQPGYEAGAAPTTAWQEQGAAGEESAQVEYSGYYGEDGVYYNADGTAWQPEGGWQGYYYDNSAAVGSAEGGQDGGQGEWQRQQQQEGSYYDAAPAVASMEAQTAAPPQSWDAQQQPHQPAYPEQRGEGGAGTWEAVGRDGYYAHAYYGQTDRMVVPVETGWQQQQQQQQQHQQQAGNGQSYVTVEVEYVECNLCGRELDGHWEARVECLTCQDYDLCTGCHNYYLTLPSESIPEGGHLREHPVRIHDPATAITNAGGGDTT